MTINPRIRENRLFQAVDRLAPYYGLKTNREDIGGLVDAVSAVSYSPNGILRSTGGSTASAPPTDSQEEAIAELLNRILHSPIGSYTSEALASRLNKFFEDPLTAEINAIEKNPDLEIPSQYNIGNLIQIIGDEPQVRRLRQTFPPILNKLKYVGILNSAGPESGGRSIPILDIPESSRPDNTKLSIVLLNSPQLNISNRYAKTVSMFLNGVPKLDMAKAVPYLEVNFELPIPPVDSDNRLLLPSIYKFILGGVQANTDTPLYSLQTALSSSSAGPAATNPGFERYQNYSVMGMEAFVSPQILYNRKNNMLQSSDAPRVNSVLDPTRPILSLKSFSTTETPNYSTYSYRTAQLQFTLHDRSRMPDIAPFIRADLRGNTRVDIEYGWHHPDGEELISSRRRNISPYVDLINGMRRKEKYQIRNSSFSFRENGSVDISLELVTLGQSQVATELIVGSEGLFTEQVQRLREIQEGLSNLLERTRLGEETSHGDSRPSVEIRGIQALEPASDAFASGLNLNSEQANQLRQLIAYLRAGSSGRRGAPRRAPVFTQIAEELERIWGDGNDASGGAARNVRNSLITEVTNAVNSMKEYVRGRPSEGNTTGWPETLSSSERAAYDPLILFSIRNGTGAGRMPGLYGLADLPTGRGRSPRSTNATTTPDTGEGATEAPTTPSEAPTEETPSAEGLVITTAAVIGLELAGARTEGYGAALGGLATSAEEPAATPEPGAAAPETPTAPATPPTPARTGTRSATTFRGRVPDYLSGNIALQNYSVSLATLMATFVGKPLMMTNLFEEVQIIFYPFNENAAFANRLNIGNFEVNLGMFTDLLIQYRMNNISRSGTMTLQEFWTFIVQNIIDNPASSSYGLWDNEGPFYRRPTAREDSESSATTRRWSARPVDDETTLNRRIAVLLEGVTPTKEFHPPQLRMFTECVPVKGEDEEVPPDSNRSVLKIHIYDQQATSLSGIGEILQAERNRALSLDGRPEVNSGDTTPMSEQWTRYRDRLISAAASGDNPILENVGGDAVSEQRYVVVGGSERIKNFVMNNYPYLIPGTAMSLINTVNLSSLQDEAANTLNLVNAPRPAELIAPNGEEPGGLPLQVIPVEMTMNTHGCPLLGFATQFFIDMKTGTTADDLYAVNQITSEMLPGKYSTQIKLRPVSGYTRYRNYINELREAASRIREAQEEEEEDRAAAAAATSARRPRGRRRRSGSGSDT